MFKENPLSVGTRLGYIFVLPASLYHPLSELAFGNLESGKLRFVRHTRSYLSNYISCRPRRFLFRSLRARARTTRLVSSADSLCFLLSCVARKIVASCKDTSGGGPITCAVVALSKREFQCISTFARNAFCV